MMDNVVLQNFLESLAKFQQLNIQEAMSYEFWNTVLISHHSTAIEGSSLTVEETSLLLSEGVTAKGKPFNDHHMVIDHHNALLQTIEYANNKETVTPAFIRHTAALVMKNTGSVVNTISGSYDISKGDFRLGMVHVGNRYFMDFKKVPDAIQALCNELNTDIGKVKSVKDIYNLAFDVHFGLVSIHPFGDGNGRVSRLLMNYVLQYHKQPLSLIFTEDKIDYFKALEESRKRESYTPFRRFMYAQQTKFFEQETAKFTRGTKWSFKRK
jgi:Fic family protein